jgi:hypothetical protein
MQPFLSQLGGAETKAASAGVREARSFVMPCGTFSETGTQGDDPVHVFGSKLRQPSDIAVPKLAYRLP